MAARSDLKALMVSSYAVLTGFLLLTVAGPRPILGQNQPHRWTSGPVVTLPAIDSAGLTFHSTLPQPKPFDTYPRTHWKEGGVVGAIVLGLAGAFLIHGLCSDSDTGEEHCGTRAVGGAALGAGVGFTIGALIGGQFPKTR